MDEAFETDLADDDSEALGIEDYELWRDRETALLKLKERYLYRLEKASKSAISDLLDEVNEDIENHKPRRGALGFRPHSEGGNNDT